MNFSAAFIYMYTILLVELDDLTRLAITYMLDALGYVVLPVATPAEALLALEGVRFDVVIFSLANPDDTGLLLAHRLNATQEGLKAIVLSGWVPSRELRTLVSAHVLKPFKLAEIDETVRAVLGMPLLRRTY